MSDLYERVHAAADAVRGRLGGKAPQVGLILGSGLGGITARVQDPVRIGFSIAHYFSDPGTLFDVVVPGIGRALGPVLLVCAVTRERNRDLFQFLDVRA